MVVMHVEHVTAEHRERIQACELVPVLLERDVGSLLSFLPQHIHQLAIRPGSTAPERLYPLENGAQGAPEIFPERYVIAHELPQRQLGIVQLELAALQKATRVEILLAQALQEQLDVRRRRDHDDPIAAPQARLQVQRDGFREGLRVAVQLSEVPVDGSFDQQRMDERISHWNRRVGDDNSSNNQSNGGNSRRMSSFRWTSSLGGNPQN